MEWVYLLRAGNFYKIGRSKSPAGRIARLQTGCPFKIELAFAVRASGRGLEEYLHTRYASHRVQGEWFELDEQIVVDVKAEMVGKLWRYGPRKDRLVVMMPDFSIQKVAA